jgi:hypothetical protein
MSREPLRLSTAIVAVAFALAACANEKFTTLGDAGAAVDASAAETGPLDGGLPEATPEEAGMTCPDAGASFVFKTRGASARMAIGFSPTPTVSRFSNTLSGGPCPMAVDALQVPYRSFLVQNATGVHAQLSAWAICRANDDAFLAFYERTTPPKSDLEVSACTGFVAEGVGNIGGRGSPEANGASWCPGLTIANGGALTLAPCATALVLFENHDADPTSNAPTGLQIQID